MWKTGRILTVAGRSSLYALEPTFSRMVYGPICLWSSLFDDRVVGCVSVVARPYRLGSVPGPDVVLCWLALLETFGLP